MLHVRLDEGNWGMSRYTTSYCPILAGTLAGCVSSCCFGERVVSYGLHLH